MKILSSLAGCVLLSLIACGSAAPETEATEPTARIASPLSSPLIYFGQLEVRAGKLKSADGTLPKAGGSATLRLFLPELGRFLCRDYCMALYPHLFVRTKGTESFIEVGGIPNGDYNMRGPQESWPRDTADVLIYLPSDADRIEVYMQWGRISWSGATCYWAYDMMECPDWFGIDGAYLSNYGRNFQIGVEP